MCNNNLLILKNLNCSEACQCTPHAFGENDSFFFNILVKSAYVLHPFMACGHFILALAMPKSLDARVANAWQLCVFA